MKNNNKPNRNHVQKSKKIYISINDHNYLINAKFSKDDLIAYLKDELTTDSHMALCNLVYKNLEKDNCSNSPDLNDFYSENESNFQHYIDSLIAQDSELNNFYLDTDVSMPISKRFALATNKYIFSPLDISAKKVKSFYDNLNQQIEKNEIKMRKIVKKNLELYNKQVEIFMERRTNATNDLLKQLDSIINNLDSKDVPHYTEKQKQDFRISCEYWGSQGWSILPNTSFEFFNKKPSSQKECDDIALEYMGKETLDNIFNYLLDLNFNKNDIESAIFCFKNNQFKACSLLLFSMIDSYLIEDQKTERIKKLKVGESAANSFNDRFKEKHKNEEELLYTVLWLTNILKCLQTFFAYANDFNNEPCIINRNFLCHGMSKKVIEKKDCIQLFLILNNMFEWKDFYE
ncbi:MAG: hypothetical protein RR266_02250 [Bacilli bacterium]